MAYMYRIGTTCNHSGCHRAQTYRVCDARNDTKGDYCKRHATARLASQQATENQLKARSAQPTAEPQAPGDVMRAHLDEFGK